MRLRNQPLTKLRGLIFALAQFDSQTGALNRSAEIQFGGRAENGIAAEDQEDVHLTRVQISNESAQVCVLIHRFCFERRSENNRVPVIAERSVDGMNQGMHFR